MNITKTGRPEWMKAELLHIERWEEEGGTTLAIEVPLNAGRFVRPSPKMRESRAWNRKFTIEPYQTRNECSKDPHE